MRRLPVTIINCAICSYAFLGIGFFVSIADNYLGRIGVLPLPPTTLAILFLLPFAGVALISDMISAIPLRRTIRLFRANFAVIVPFALVALCALGFSIHPSAYWKEKSKWIFLIPYSFVVFVFAMFLPYSAVVRKYFHWFSFGGLVALAASIFTDSLYPLSFSVEPNRPAGFPGNANWGALSLVMLTAATLRYDLSRYRVFDLTVLSLGGIGVFLTLSRSGMTNLILLICIYFGFVLFGPNSSRRNRPMIIASAFFVMLFFAITLTVVVTQMQSTGHLSSQSRLLGFLQGELVDDGSSAERLGAAQHALELIAAAPLIGYGTGHTRTMPMTPHNLYLQQWVNNGLPGVLSYLLLLVGSFWMFYRRRFPQGMALICCTAVGGFFSHNILEQRSFLILLGAFSTISLFDACGKMNAGITSTKHR